MSKNVDTTMAVWPLILWSAVGVVCAITGFYTMYTVLMDKVSPLPVWLQLISAVGYLSLMLKAACKLNSRAA